MGWRNDDDDDEPLTKTRRNQIRLPFTQTQPAYRCTIVSRGVPTVEQETGAVRRQRSDDTLPAPPTAYETRDEAFKAVCTSGRRKKPASKLVTGVRRTQQMHLRAVDTVKHNTLGSQTRVSKQRVETRRRIEATSGWPDLGDEPGSRCLRRTSEAKPTLVVSAGCGF